MIKIKNIKVQGYKLFEDTRIGFEGKQGLVNLLGKNLDFENFDSNSSGKSSFADIFIQIIWGKNLANTPQTEIKHKYSDTDFCGSIELEITKDNEVTHLYIKRDNQFNTLDFKVNGIKTEFRRKSDIQNEIDSELGIGLTTFKKLFYLSPTEKTLFSISQDSGQNKFIKELLNLDLIDSVYKKADKELKIYNSDLVSTQKEVKLLQSHVEGLTSQLSALPQSEVKNVENELKELTLEVQSKKREKDTLMSTLDKIKKEYREKKNIKATLSGTLSQIKKAKVKAQNLISEGNCPTCSQKVDSSLLGLSELNDEIESIFSNISKLEKELRNFDTQMEQIKLKLAPIDESIYNLDSKINKLNAENELFQKDGGLNSVKDKVQNEIVSKSEELVKLQHNLTTYEDFIYCLSLIKQCSGEKGFIKSRVELFLRLFNKRLHTLSNQLTKGDIQLRVKKDSKGNYGLYVKDQVEHEYKALSSGLKARVDLLLNLTLRQALKDLTGVSINILIIDELIGSVDEGGKQGIESMLNEIKKEFPDTLIFVVSHGHSIRADHSLLITRENNSSTLSWL